MRMNWPSIVAVWSLALCGTAYAFELSVPAISDEKWDQKYLAPACDGQNVSPAVAWENAPVGTKSFVVTLYDRDALGGFGWWHWQVFKIPAAATGLPEGAGTKGNKGLPKGASLGTGDLGKPGYLGPCPPKGSGVHHYVFTVYALKSAKPETEANASPGMILADTMRDALDNANVTYTLTR
jgi:Raf kinase inhibitor-like YbhB/YbcL family protein